MFLKPTVPGFTKPGLFFLVLICCTLLAGLMLAHAVGFNLTTSPVSTDGNTSHTALPTGKRPAQPVPKVQESSDQTAAGPPMVVVYSTPYGFEPSQLTFSPGLKRFLIRNRTGFDKLTYQLNRASGENVLTVTPPTTLTSDGKNLIASSSLGTGEYVLTVTDHPQWMCRVTVK